MTRIGGISGDVSGTLDVDIKTLGGSLVPAGPLPISGTVTFNNVLGTLDVDIKTLGGSLVPYGNLPVNATCSTVHVDAVSGTTAMADDASNSPSQWVDISGNTITYKTYLYGYDKPNINWDRLRTTDSMVSSTLGVGLLAIGEFGYDGSAWRYKHVDTSGNMVISGTSTLAGILGTMDVDIKTIGGSLVPAGPLPVNATQSGSWSIAGTIDTYLYGYNGATWDNIRTTGALAGGTIDTGLLAVGRVPPADPVEKIASFTAATSTYAVWTPAAGKRWNLTDFVISTKNATDVTLYDGTTSTKANFYLAANGGVVMDLQIPFVATGTSTPLTISLTAATLSITTSGYETT